MTREEKIDRIIDCLVQLGLVVLIEDTPHNEEVRQVHSQ